MSLFRYMFQEAHRTRSDVMDPTIRAIEAFSERLQSKIKKETPFSKYYRLELTARAFVRALDELEQSVYCCNKYAEGIVATSEAELSEEQVDDYYRHLYFYKNGFIRIFSVLDKLGYFMNDWFDVRTERVKPKFSYYTVLRQMTKQNRHPHLVKTLQGLKLKHKESMQHLRKKRNYEIHLINIEMLDDLMLQDKQLLEHAHIENLSANIDELLDGFEMACRSMEHVFKYITRKS